MSHYYRSLIQTVVPPTGLPLDNYTTNLEMVASVRRLLTSYTGALIEVRRASDNATLSFLPNSNGVLAGNSEDTGGTTTLATFLSSTTGFVSRWYNQTGGEDFTQTATSRQPQIDLSPIPTSQVMIYQDGSTPVGLATLNTPFDFSGNNETTYIMTFARDGAPPNLYHTLFYTSISPNIAGNPSNPYILSFKLNTANIQSFTANTGSRVLLSGGLQADQTLLRSTFVRPASGNATATQNTGETGTSSGTTHTAFNGYLIFGNFAGRSAKGWYGDVIVWNRAVDNSDIAIINEEIDDYYGI